MNIWKKDYVMRRYNKQKNRKGYTTRGYEEMMKRLDPKWVIFYGIIPPECDWNVIRVKPHQDEIVKRRLTNASRGRD